MPTVSQFGRLLAAHMREASLTSGKLSKLTTLPRASIYNWISGRSPSPRDWDDILTLATALSLNDDEIDQLLKSANFPPDTIRKLANLASADSQQSPHAYPAQQYIPTAETDQLIGSTQAIQQIVTWLLDKTEHQFISLQGIGGIGKTTLARAAIDDNALRQQFTTVVWVSARQEQLSDRGVIEPIKIDAHTANDVVTKLTERLGYTQWSGLTTNEQLARLRPILTTAPHLIVIDNLETLADVETLLPSLRQLAQPTRFLLTSRQSLEHFPFVRCYSLTPLSKSDSIDLITSEIGRRGRTITFSTVQRDRIFALVGGLPLALKLLAGQLSYQPLAVVMTELRDGSLTKPADIYAYIYHAIWCKLRHEAKALLLSMLDVSSEGEAYSWIKSMSGLSDDEFTSALRELLDYSLVEIVGQMIAPHYFLHRMTITFLQTAILGMQTQQERVT